MSKSFAAGAAPTRRRIIKSGTALVGGIAAPAFLSIGSAFAAYPERPVKIVVANTPGGPSDIIARIIAAELQIATGGTFVVENKGGAGGNIGMGNAARAAPDGYTLAVVSSSFMVNPGLYEKLPYDPEKDFVPITIAAYAPNLLAVNPMLPVNTVSELVALVRANPGKYNFGHSGVGTTPHLSG